MSKFIEPDWSKAPEWANWYSCDVDGAEYWHAERPTMLDFWKDPLSITPRPKEVDDGVTTQLDMPVIERALVKSLNKAPIILDYVILSHRYMGDLGSQIKRKSQEGFQLHGAPSFNEGEWCQAMVKYEIFINKYPTPTTLDELQEN